MDIKLLRAFAELVKVGNYSRASQNLFMTQSTLSKQIKTLEENIGIRLFDRGRYGAILTENGKLFSHRTKELLNQYHELQGFVNKIGTQNQGVLSLAFSQPTLIESTRLVATFSEDVHKIKIQLKEVSSAEQGSMIMSGAIDAGFMTTPISGVFQSRVLQQQDIMLAHSTKHDFRDENILEILQRLPLVSALDIEDSAYTIPGTLLLERQNISPAFNVNVNNIQDLLCIVDSGDGVALLPKCINVKGFKNINFHSIDMGKGQWKTLLVWNPNIKNIMRDDFIESFTR